MNTQQLIELACLHALALLDPDEQEEFERAFAAAPPAVQAQVRREQTRLCGIESLLPVVDPPPGLRARVIAAVREAIAAVRPRRHAPGRDAPPLLRTRRVSPVWRAAAIGLAAAAVVFAYTTLEMRTQFDRLETAVTGNQQADVLRRALQENIGDILFDEAYQKIVFVPASPNIVARASFWWNPEEGTGLLQATDLAPTDDRPYRLVFLRDDGEIDRTIAEFSSTGVLLQREVKLTAAAGARLAIARAVEDGYVPILTCILPTRTT